MSIAVANVKTSTAFIVSPNRASNPSSDASPRISTAAATTSHHSRLGKAPERAPSRLTSRTLGIKHPRSIANPAAKISSTPMLYPSATVDTPISATIALTTIGRHVMTYRSITRLLHEPARNSSRTPDTPHPAPPPCHTRTSCTWPPLHPHAVAHQDRWPPASRAAPQPPPSRWPFRSAKRHPHVDHPGATTPIQTPGCNRRTGSPSTPSSSQLCALTQKVLSSTTRRCQGRLPSPSWFAKQIVATLHRVPDRSNALSVEGSQQARPVRARGWRWLCDH